MNNHDRNEQKMPTRLDIYQDGQIVEASDHPIFRAEVRFDDNPIVESIDTTPERLNFIKRNGGFKGVRFDPERREMVTVAEAKRRRKKRDEDPQPTP
jgi:hypothetical protein